MSDILNRIDNVLDEASYRQNVSHGSPLDTSTNEGPQLPAHLANTLSVMTGIDVQTVDAFVELVGQGQSIASAAAEVGLSIGQAHDLKTAMVDVGMNTSGGIIESHPGAVEARRTADFLYRLAEAADLGEDDAAGVCEGLAQAVKEAVSVSDLLGGGGSKTYEGPSPEGAAAVLTLAQAILLDLGMEAESEKLERIKKKMRPNRAAVMKMAVKLSKKAKQLGLMEHLLEADDPGNVPDVPKETELSPSGFQKYSGLDLPEDARQIAQTYAMAICDNLPSSHPGRLTCTFGSATGDAKNAMVQGRDEDGNEMTVTVSLGGSPPYVMLQIGGDLDSSITMKLLSSNWMAALSLMMQHVVRGFMQAGYTYDEAI